MIKKTFFLIPKNLKKQFIFIIFLIFMGSILEMLGIGLVFPIIAVFSSEDLFYDNLFRFGVDESLIKNLLVYTGFSLVQFLILLFFFTFTLRTLFLIVVVKFQIRFILRLYEKLSTKVFKNYLSKSYSFFFKNNSAFLIRNISGETSIFSNYVLNGIITLISEGLLLLSILILLLIIDFKITSYLVIIISFIGMIIYFLGKKKITSASILRQELEGKRQKNLQTLYNIKEIKIAQLEKFFYENFQFLSKKLKKVNDTYLFLQQLPRFLIEFFSILILGSVIFFSSRNLDNSIVPLLAVYAASAFRILPSVNRIIQNFNQINFGKPSIDTLYDTFSNIKKDTNLYKTSNERISFESVELKNISFSYDERKQIIFNEINFHIKKGDFIGIVGPSGSGKSTFVNLICGLISPTKGEILINNNLNLNDITNEFLNFTGYLSQNTSLFDDTIKNNICLSDDQKKAFDEKNYQDVIKKAQLDDFIEKLPLKNDSIVGENGITLSGGQKQRVGIARALFKNPDLLIFDEPTSSLDNKTSEKLIQIIKDLNKYKSIILITHDENIVKNCNKIIYLDGKGNFNVK